MSRRPTPSRRRSRSRTRRRSSPHEESVMKGVTNFLTFLGAVFGLGYYYYQYEAAKLDYERKAAESPRLLEGPIKQQSAESQKPPKAPPQQAPAQSICSGPITAASSPATLVHGQTPWLLPSGQVVQPVCY